MTRTICALLLMLAAASPLAAQEHDRPEMHADSAMHATMLGPLGIPQAREGSGTSWLPDASPMYAHHFQFAGWGLMLHYNAFLQYIDQGSERGGEEFGSINWFMAMARRELAGGELGLRVMISLDAITVGGCGYPDLLATGEFCDGLGALHDRQHPHDLFMELAASYQRELTDDLAFQLYGGLVGEPTLGPTAYPHRISALSNPLAPISHHWLDATHIAFGVITVGLFGRHWKIEGSLFNGREPDEERFGFDFAPLDSYSGRIWFLPNDQWALQVSAGHLTEAEVHERGEPRRDVNRFTASATYHRRLGELGIWATTVAWGRNHEPSEDRSTDAFLAESSLNLDGTNIVYGRLEVNEKSAADLVIEELGHEVFTVGKLQLGYVRQFGRFGHVVPGIGASVSINVLPEGLEPFYGTTTPVGFAVFARIRPAPMMMGMGEASSE